MIRRYTLGNEIVLVGTFVDASTDQPKNPTSVRLRLKTPSNVELVPAVHNPREGVFNAAVTPNEAGLWHARWEGSGAVVAAWENSFEVKASAF